MKRPDRHQQLLYSIRFACEEKIALQKRIAEIDEVIKGYVEELKGEPVPAGHAPAVNRGVATEHASLAPLDATLAEVRP